MRRLLLLTIVTVLSFGLAQAQEATLESLKAMKAEKEAARDALQGEIDGLDGQIYTFPGWKYGATGILGFNLDGNDNWYAVDNAYATSNGLGLGVGAFANLDREGYFWRNQLNVDLKRVVTKPDSRNDDETEAISDALNFSSLYGKKIAPKWAISAEANYLSTLLNFNDPGKLTLSAGITWLPITDLVVLIHPLGYEFNWPSGDYASAAGCKIGASYMKEIVKGIAWTSNLNMFIPYGGSDVTLPGYAYTDAMDVEQTVADLPVTYEGGDMMNWTWVNGFTTKILGGIGVGLKVGLRSDKQLANASRFSTGNGSFDLGGADNPMQLFYNLGLAYTL